MITRYIVHLKEGVLPTTLTGVVKVWKLFPRVVIVEKEEGEMETFMQNSGIKSVTGVGKVSVQEVSENVDAKSYNDVWGVKMVGAEDVHASGNRGQGVRVCILDTGIRTDHEDINVVDGKNFISPGTFPDDDHGHGTHVHGTLAGLLNGKGVVGVAPDAEVYHAKTMNSGGSGSWENVLDGMNYATELTEGGTIPVVSNHSYGGTSYPGTAVEEAFQIAVDNGVMILAAAGNTGAGVDKVIYPARFDTAIAVAAVDQQKKRAYFSAVGPGVEVAAPGVGTRSTCFRATNEYCDKSGTSMATPHVAGCFVLAVKAGITDLRKAIETSTDRGSRTPELGWGVLDARKLTRTGNPAYSRHVRLDGTYSSDPDGEVVKYEWDIGDGTFFEGDAMIEHRYEQDGKYRIGLKVTDGDGLQNLVIKNITITSGGKLAPIANFVVTSLGA